jgi:hypothetical protein
VIDVQLQNHIFTTQYSSQLERFQSEAPAQYPCLGKRYVFVPSVYDSILIIRPSISFRDGSVASNTLVDHGLYLSQLPFNASIALAFLQLIPAYFSSPSTKSYFDLSDQELSFIAIEETLVGYTAVFMLSKSYQNFVIAEINQLCYGGILRSVALGSTDGLSTWNVHFVNMYQPVSVPVGRISLGRIFNVTGSSIDSYADLMTSCCFYQYPLIATAIDSSESTQRSGYCIVSSSKGTPLRALGRPYAQHCHHLHTEHLIVDKTSSMYRDLFHNVTISELDIWVYFYLCYYTASNATQLPSN